MFLKQSLRLFACLAVSATLLVSFQNCSQGFQTAEFSSLEKSESLGLNAGPGTPVAIAPHVDLAVAEQLLVNKTFTFTGVCENGLPVQIHVASLEQTAVCSSNVYSSTLDLTAFNDGSLVLEVSQTNQAGLTTKKTKTIVKDTTAPQISITSPAANANVASPVVISGLCESGLPVLIEGANLTASSTFSCVSGMFSGSVSLKPDVATVQVMATQTDAAQNKKSDSKSYQIPATPMPPVQSSVMITAPAANTVSKSGVTLQGNCQNGLIVQISGQGVLQNSTVNCVSGSFSANITFSNGDGVKSVMVSQTDAQSNTGMDIRTFMKDSTAPVLSFTSPAVGAFVKESILLTGACESGLQVMISGAVSSSSQVACANNSFMIQVSLSSGEGMKNVTVSQTDSVGNTGTASRNFIKDTVAPAVQFNSPAANTVGETGLVLAGTCESGLIVMASGSGVKSVVTQMCNSNAFSLSILFSDNDGQKVVELSQTDAAGNKGTVTRNFIRTTSTSPGGTDPIIPPPPINVNQPAPVTQISLNPGQTTTVAMEISAGGGIQSVNNNYWKSTAAGAYVEYTLSAPDAGEYGLSLAYRLKANTTSSMEMYVNGVKIAQSSLVYYYVEYDYPQRLPNIMTNFVKGTNKVRIVSTSPTQFFEFHSLQINYATVALPKYNTVQAISPTAQTSIAFDAPADFYRQGFYISGADKTRRVWSCVWSYCFVEFLVSVEKAGAYQVAVEYMPGSNTGGHLAGAQVVVNRTIAAVYRLNPKQSGDPSFKLTQAQSVQLSAGVSRLRLENPNYIDDEFCWGTDYSGLVINPL